MQLLLKLNLVLEIQICAVSKHSLVVGGTTNWTPLVIVKDQSSHLVYLNICTTK